MSTAFVRWSAVGMVLAGVTGCLGGGGSVEGDAPARAESRPAAPEKGKGAQARSDQDAPAKGAAPAKGGDRDRADSPAKGADPDPSDAPAGAADSAKLKLVEGKAWLDSEQGFLKIAGEVKNQTGQWLTSVKVTIRLYDASGKELGSDSIATAVAQDLHQEPVERVYTELTYVPPGETAVFYWLRDVKKIKGTYASHKLSVTALPAENPPTVTLSGLKTEKDQDGRWRVSGKIENTGRVGCRTPKGVFGLYDASGKILGALSEEPDAMFQKVLAPGQSVEVERKNIQMDDLPIASIKGWADCNVP